MILIKETLESYKSDEFFKKINEEEENDDTQKNKAELEKRGRAVVKKCISNFKNFKQSAGDKWQEYRDFWSSQKNAEESISQKGLYYNLFNSDYIVGVTKQPDGKAALEVINTSAKDTDEYRVFKTKNKNVIAEFLDFMKNDLESTMKDVIAQQKAAMAAKRAAEEANRKSEKAEKKRSKIDAFLSESSDSYKRFRQRQKERFEGLSELDKFYEYWLDHYSHVSLEMTKEEVQDFIDEFGGYKRAADMAYDYHLSQGLGEVQE